MCWLSRFPFPVASENPDSRSTGQPLDREKAEFKAELEKSSSCGHGSAAWSLHRALQPLVAHQERQGRFLASEAKFRRL